MRFLIFNVGSATIKYTFYENNKFSTENEKYYKNYDELESIVKKILRENYSDVIIHRVVHGGDLKNCLISDKVLKEIEKFNELAPLHNIPQVKVIKLCKRLSKAKQIAIFDSAFFLDMPEIAKQYALPMKISKKLKIRRYGFQGINHFYLADKIKKILNRDVKLITCHLGGGCSITAWQGLKPLDTSMGFTPLEGIPMVTRTGSIDPFIPLYLEKKLKLNADKINDLLNKESGLFGLTGTKDVKAIVENKKYSKAFELFCYHIAKKISSYVSVLNGLDVLVFSAGIGERSSSTRERICKYLECFGLKLDHTKNLKNQEIISSKESKIKVFVIPANEKEIMLREAKKLL